MLNIAILLLLVSAPTSSALWCYVGFHDVAELYVGFDICLTTLDLSTYEFSYDGIHGLRHNTKFQENSDLIDGICYPAESDHGRKVNCYCKSQECNRIDNVEEVMARLPSFI